MAFEVGSLLASLVAHFRRHVLELSVCRGPRMQILLVL